MKHLIHLAFLLCFYSKGIAQVTADSGSSTIKFLPLNYYQPANILLVKKEHAIKFHHLSFYSQSSKFKMYEKPTLNKVYISIMECQQTYTSGDPYLFTSPNSLYLRNRYNSYCSSFGDNNLGAAIGAILTAGYYQYISERTSSNSRPAKTDYKIKEKHRHHRLIPTHSYHGEQ